ncbi:hypothetical protein L1076_26525 [Vibrio sp. MMG022]|uniref:hypothetical protein n=1 Tax=Vibrio sp. MMG023 TaxID=2909979 RepID=UPI001F312107|nr:hypothetical protein [Vibrio sp. MMG023]MCF6455143.1 hypothetical protein [Vibrio sp. MMG023]
MKFLYLGLIGLTLIGCDSSDNEADKEPSVAEEVVNENPPKGGTIKHLSGKKYQLLINDGEEIAIVEADLLKHWEAPIKPKGTSIKSSWEFTTEECGNLNFKETVMDKIICDNCPSKAIDYVDCPSQVSSTNMVEWKLN